MTAKEGNWKMKNRNCPPGEGRRFFHSEVCGFLSVAWRTLSCFVAVMGAVSYSGCDASSRKTHQSDGEKTMETATLIQKNTAAIPPIDAAAPLETATATFALG